MLLAHLVKMQVTAIPSFRPSGLVLCWHGKNVKQCDFLDTRISIIVMNDRLCVVVPYEICPAMPVSVTLGVLEGHTAANQTLTL